MEATFLNFFLNTIFGGGLFVCFVTSFVFFAKQLRGELGQHVFQQKIASFVKLEIESRSRKKKTTFG
jgi:hypothetical protein